MLLYPSFGTTPIADMAKPTSTSLSVGILRHIVLPSDSSISETTQFSTFIPKDFFLVSL